MNPTTYDVNFRGDLLSVMQKEGGDGYVAIRRVCEALGMSYSSQLQKLKKKSWARLTTAITLTSDGFHARPMQMIAIDDVAMWMATLDAHRVRPELREKVDLYQKECAKFLHEHLLSVKSPPHEMKASESSPGDSTRVAPPPSGALNPAYTEAKEALGLLKEAGILTGAEYAVHRMRLVEAHTSFRLSALSPAPLQSPEAVASAAGGKAVIIGQVVDTEATGPLVITPLDPLDGTYSARTLGAPYGLTSTQVKDLAVEAGYYGADGLGVWDRLRHGNGEELTTYWRYNETGKRRMAPILEAHRRNKPPILSPVPSTPG